MNTSPATVVAIREPAFDACTTISSHFDPLAPAVNTVEVVVGTWRSVSTAPRSAEAARGVLANAGAAATSGSYRYAMRAKERSDPPPPPAEAAQLPTPLASEVRT